MFIIYDLLRYSGRVFINLMVIELVLAVLRLGPKMIRKKIRRGFKQVSKILSEKDEGTEK